MKNKLSIGVAAIFVAGVLAAGVCCAGFASRDEDGAWFKNRDLSTWHWNDPANEDENDNEDGESGISAMSFGIPVEQYEEYGVSPQAIQASSIAATFDPPNTSDQRVTFVFDWEDPDSEWARGKEISDYIGYTAAENYAPSCSVWATQAYGETIICTVTSLANPALKDTVRLEYVARVSNLSPIVYFLDDYIDAGIYFGAMVMDSSIFGTGSVNPTSCVIKEVNFELGREWEYILQADQYFSIPISYIHNAQPDNLLRFGDLFDLARVHNDDPWDCIIDGYYNGYSEYYVAEIELCIDYYYNGELILGDGYYIWNMRITQEFLNYISIPANSLSASKDIYF